MIAVSSRARWMALIAATTGWMLDGFELGLYPLVSTPALKELLGDRFASDFTFWNSVIIATFLIGAALGGWIFGWVGDRIGRVRAMLITVLLFSVFSFLCAFATQAWHIAALRFIAALGMGGEWALGVALVMEAWPSTTRPLMAGLIGAAGNIGFLACALISYSLASFGATVGSWLAPVVPATWLDPAHGYWRLMFVLGLLPAVAGLAIRLFVPESEAWKLSQATATSKPRLAHIFVAPWRSRVLIGTLLAAMALVGTWACVQNLPAWAFALTDKTPEQATARSLTLIASALGATCGAFLAPLLAQAVGRRRSYAILSAVSLLMGLLLFQHTTVYGTQFLLMVGLIGACTASFYGWLPLYLPELFATRIRATAQGFSYNAGRLITAAVILITGITGLSLVNGFGDYPTMFRSLCFVYILGLIVIWFAPETKGQPLPE